MARGKDKRRSTKKDTNSTGSTLTPALPVEGTIAEALQKLRQQEQQRLYERIIPIDKPSMPSFVYQDVGGFNGASDSKDAPGSAGRNLKDDIIATLNDASDVVRNVPIVGPYAGTLENVGRGLETKGEGIGAAVGDTTKTIIERIPDAIGDVWGSFKSFVSGVPGGIATVVNAFGNALGNIAGGIAGAFSDDGGGRRRRSNDRENYYSATFGAGPDSYSFNLPVDMSYGYSGGQQTQPRGRKVPGDDIHWYGGSADISIPYLEHVTDAETDEAEINRRLEDMVPTIAKAVISQNPYLTDEQIDSLIDRTTANMKQYMVTRAANERKYNEIMRAVESGNTQGLSQEALDEMKKLGLLDDKGQLKPGALATAQQSLSATFDDQKNQYPVTLQVATPTKVSRYNQRAIAWRSALTDEDDYTYYAPEFAPMSAAQRPASVTGVQAHVTRQGSTTYQASPPPQPLTISPSGSGGGSSRPTPSASDVVFRYSIAEPSAAVQVNMDDVVQGRMSLSPFGVGALTDAKYQRNLMVPVLHAVAKYTGGKNIPNDGELQQIMNRINTDNGGYASNRNILEKDLNNLSRVLGADDFPTFVHKLINAEGVSYSQESLTALVGLMNNFVQTGEGGSRPQDMQMLYELRGTLEEVKSQPGKFTEKIQEWKKQAKELFEGADTGKSITVWSKDANGNNIKHNVVFKDANGRNTSIWNADINKTAEANNVPKHIVQNAVKEKYKSLHKLVFLAALNRDWQGAVAAKDAPLRAQGLELQKHNEEFWKATHGAFASWLGRDNIRYLEQNQWHRTSSLEQGVGIAYSALGAMLARMY